VIVFLVLWPALAIHFAADSLAATPLFAGVEPAALRWGMTAGAVQLWREHLVVGLVLAAVTVGVALASGGRESGSRLLQLAGGVGDGALVALALAAGIALEYPATLRHPGWTLLLPLPVCAAQCVQLAVLAALGLVLGRRRGTPLRHVAVAAGLVVIGLAAARGPAVGRAGARSGVRLLLGIDSLSRAEIGEQFRALAVRRGGSYYARAVTPGLLTNVVWASVLTSHRPSELGVFFTFQAPDWGRMPPNLVERARDAGLHTVAFFADQFTMQLGADLPFDEDRSGPRGWRQVATCAVKDAGLFLPIVLPYLPRIRGATAPANQEGTFAFSLRRELADVLTAGRDGGPSLVLAHLDYLHQPRYPGLSELTPQERARVRQAKVAAVIDKSIDWQYPPTEGEPVDVYRWKLANLGHVVVEAIEASGFTDPARKNALVLFSDHGPRTGLMPGDFAHESYYGVPLLTFGLPARDVDAPISLLDLASLVGLPSPLRPDPAEPVVEYVNVTNDEWAQFVREGHPLLDGGVTLPRALLSRIGSRLLAFRPYAGKPGYSSAATAPAVERSVPQGAMVSSATR
jgi:hypothetical protein